MGREERHDDVSQTLETLLQMPVGRRWLLKMGINSATAAAQAAYALEGHFGSVSGSAERLRTPLLDGSTGQPRIDPALGVAEPSLSRFDPS
jgi:hypothetical protein